MNTSSYFIASLIVFILAYTIWTLDENGLLSDEARRLSVFPTGN